MFEVRVTTMLDQVGRVVTEFETLEEATRCANALFPECSKEHFVDGSLKATDSNGGTQGFVEIVEA